MTSVDLEGTVAALEYSMRGIEFGDVKLISHVCPRLKYRGKFKPKIKYEYTHKMSTIDEWNYSIIHNLGKHLDTDFALLIHADGFVVNSEMWQEDWLNYDYIGAPWPLPQDNYSYRDNHGNIIRVGNSVSLRSKRLIDLPNKLKLPWHKFHGNTNEDGYICVNYRHEYLFAGMKFAPLEVAKDFSRETPLPENEGLNPFCFHRYEGENAIYPVFKKPRL